GARLRERTACAGVARLFEPHAIAGIEQAAEDHLEPALRTGDDEHLVGRAARAARDLDVFRDRLPQVRMTGRIGVTQLSRRHRSRATTHEPRPQAKGKPIERRHAEAERTRRTTQSPGGTRSGGKENSAPRHSRMSRARRTWWRPAPGQVVG